VVEPEELDKVRPAKDKALVLEQFVPVHQIDPVFFAGRSLYRFQTVRRRGIHME